MRFLGALAALAPDSEVGGALTESLMRKLASHLGAADRSVRFRAAQGLAYVLQVGGWMWCLGCPCERGVAEQGADHLFTTRLHELPLRTQALPSCACAPVAGSGALRKPASIAP